MDMIIIQYTTDTLKHAHIIGCSLATPYQAGCARPVHRLRGQTRRHNTASTPLAEALPPFASATARAMMQTANKHSKTLARSLRQRVAFPKGDVLTLLNSCGLDRLMCSDRTNAAGALKQAHIGAL